MDIFIVEEGIVKPTVHALLLPPYSDIWKRDTNKDKHVAIQEFTYIEFMCSMKKSNPYRGLPEEKRKESVAKSIFRDAPYTPDELVCEAMEFYMKLNIEASPTIQYFLATKIGAEKVIDFLHKFDLNERNERNLPIYKPKEITTSLADAFNVMSTLTNLEKKVFEEQLETVKTRANKEINKFEE